MTKSQKVLNTVVSFGLCVLTASAAAVEPVLAATEKALTQQSTPDLLANTATDSKALLPIERCKAGACTLNYGSAAQMGQGTNESLCLCRRRKIH